MKSLFIALPVVVFFLISSAHADPKKGEAVFKAKLCFTCHAVGETGSDKVGPDLAHVGAKIKRADLLTWIRDPQAKKPDTKMPKPRITAEELDDLVDYLQSLH